MNITDIFYGIGNFCQNSFHLLRFFGNKAHINVFFIIIGFIALFVWLKMQADYNKKADENGTLK